MRNIAIINHFEKEGEGYYSDMVNRARFENLKDLLMRIKKSGLFDRIILQTNNIGNFTSYKWLEVQDTTDIPNFGERLNRILVEEPNSRVFYSGSGSSVFLTIPQMKRYLNKLSINSIIANNLYSADYLFIRSGIKNLKIEEVKMDNSLPRILIENYSFYGMEIKRDEFSLFDIDGPLDLIALKKSSRGGTNLKRFLSNLRLYHKVLEKGIENFTDRKKEVLFWGRVSEFLIQFLRYRTACRTKFLVEGRGMVSQGLKGFYSIFFDAFMRQDLRFLFNNLRKYCDTLFLDSRILFAHLGVEIEREERFALDMHDISSIKTKELLRLLLLARESGIPVIFCNHSFLNSGIPIIIDSLWRGKGFRSYRFSGGIVREIID